MAEKNGNYDSEVGNGTPAYEHDVYGERKMSKVNEGTTNLGDVGQVERYGYVERGLKSRHIQFIALGGTIGTGLFLGIGSALTTAGPLSVLLGYSFVGLAVFGMMQCLGEMATWLPLPGAIPQFCARYSDPALGFAVGWNNWYSSSITLCAEISAASVVIAYWPGAQDINPSAWISLILVLILCLNIFAVSIYGEAEFIFASVKIVTIVGLLIMAFIVDLGGNPNHERLGFWTWQHPGAMIEFDGTGNWGRFVGLFSTLINATFAYGGVELVAVAAGEAENPRKNIPKAVRRVFWRILFFYVLGSLAIGVLVASDDPHLLKAQADGAPGAAQSPWVIGIQNAGITVLPSIINAVILTSASSSANAFLYTGSRYMYALAQNRQAPSFLLTCSKNGVPYYAVLITWVIGFLTYLSASPNAGAALAFTWFQNLVSIAQLFTWMSILIAYLGFYYALKAQNIDRDTLVFKSKFQPYLAWGTLIFFTVVVFLQGFNVFVSGHWNTSNFVAAYIGFPIYFGCYFAWKIIKRTKWVKPAEADLHTGQDVVDAEDWPEQEPRNVFERIWFWIA
jgi:amino acid transporter